MVPSVPVLAAPPTAKSLKPELRSYPLAPSAGGVNLRLLPSGKGKFSSRRICVSSLRLRGEVPSFVQGTLILKHITKPCGILQVLICDGICICAQRQVI